MSGRGFECTNVCHKSADADDQRAHEYAGGIISLHGKRLSGVLAIMMMYGANHDTKVRVMPIHGWNIMSGKSSNREENSYRLFVDDGVIVGAVGLLLVVDPVLPHRDDALRLDGAHQRPDQLGAQHGVLSGQILERAPVVRDTTDAKARTSGWMDVNEYFVVNEYISQTCVYAHRPHKCIRTHTSTHSWTFAPLPLNSAPFAAPHSVTASLDQVAAIARAEGHCVVEPGILLFSSRKPWPASFSRSVGIEWFMATLQLSAPTRPM